MDLRKRLAGLAVEPLLCIALLMALWYTLPTWQRVKAEWNSTATPTWIGTAPWDPDKAHHAPDIDAWFLHEGLVKAPRFRDTWRWWVGTWVGQVPFYRPLTSMVFWAEWRLFRDQEVRYTLFALVIHLMAVWQFLLLGHALFRRYRCPLPQWAMLISGVVFINGLFVFPTRPFTNWFMFDPWKNQPDSLSALFFFLSLRSYIRAMEDRTARRSLGLAVIWFIAACLCKELAIVLPLLLIPLEWPHLRGRNSVAAGPTKSGNTELPRSGARVSQEVTSPAPLIGWRRIFPMILVMTAFLFVRALCLKQPIGFLYGENSDWPQRLRNEAFGPLMRVVHIESAQGAIVVALGLLLFVVGIVNVLRRRTQLAAFGYTWVLSTLIFPLLTPSIGSFVQYGIRFSHYTNLHRYYLVEGGFALMLGCGLMLIRRDERYAAKGTQDIE